MSKIRIITGIVLFLFVLGHLTNLAFGLISIEAMEAARPIFMGLWTNPVGGPILLVSFLTHAGLGLWTLYNRNTLAMNWRDGSQALLGLAIIPLLLPHIMGVGIGPFLTGMKPTYEWVLAVYWLFAPGLGIQQVLALIVIWVHGCYGLLLWLQVQDRVGWTTGLIWPFVVIVPASALLGFVDAGKTVFGKQLDPEFMAPIKEQSRLYQPYAEQLWSIHDVVLWVFLAIVAAVLAARYVRLRKQTQTVSVTYKHGPILDGPSGLSLLEMARQQGLPHASLCGARGRCGSCAVRVISGADRLSPIGTQEAAALERTQAQPGHRLACQAMPLSGAFEVERVFDPRILPSEYRARLRGEAEQPEAGPAVDQTALESEARL